MGTWNTGGSKVLFRKQKMKLIAHRGNLHCPNKNEENNPAYIEHAIDMGYDTEIDIWFTGSELFLGHDEPQYLITIDWLENYKNKLWIHCKNLNSLLFFTNHQQLNYFWHQTDNFTLTSKGYIWTYPNNPTTHRSVIVVPFFEITDNILKSYAVCTDHVNDYVTALTNFNYRI